MSFISLQKGYCRKENKSKPQTHFFSPVMVGSCKNWCSEWVSGLTPLASLQDMVLVRCSHLLQPCHYFHSSLCKESLTRTSPHLPAPPSRAQRGSDVQPPHAWLLPYPQPFVWAGATTRLWQGHSSPPADGVTELSCPCRESICQEIMIMDHPIPVQAACFPFHTSGTTMDSRKKTFSGAS